MTPVDVLVVSLGATAGLRAADAALAGALRRAGAHVEIAAARAPRELRTYALTDLAWARAARGAARAAIAAHDPRAIVYSTTTAALLWPRPGAIRFDAPSAANRPGRHGVWQRPLEHRRLQAAPLLVPWDAGSLAEAPRPHADAIVVPIAVAPSPDSGAPRDIAAITYAANPQKKGLDRVLAAWAQARTGDEQLVVAGADLRLGDVPGVTVAGRLAPADYRALLRRARVFVTAPRREDYGIAQLEALADGCRLVTTAAPGPYAALPMARALDPRLVPAEAAGLAAALRTALDEPFPDYARRAAAALAPFGPDAVDAVVRDELLPRLLR
ncbi:MAG: glycosyltransferase [Solirubrobacteraceae bacterium]|nr:glycosyltransferase [Solirubrobacteraceae bacterium]